jgi:hypothetical protein
LKKAVSRFGTDITVVNGNGSENMKDAESYLASLGITQYWTRPKAPKGKPLNNYVYKKLLNYYNENNSIRG